MLERLHSAGLAVMKKGNLRILLQVPTHTHRDPSVTRAGVVVESLHHRS